MTILVSSPNTFGPGLKVVADSSGTPGSPGAFWNIVFSLGTTIANTFWIERHNTTGPLNVYAMTVPSTGAFSTQVPNDDTTVTMELQFINPGHATDVLDVTGTWEATKGLGVQAVQLSQSPITSGGLTTDQATQLETSATNSQTAVDNWTTYTSITLPSLNDVLGLIQQGITTTFIDPLTSLPQTIGSIFSGKTLDTISTNSVTGGPTCDPIDAMIGADVLIFGVILRITTVPDWYAFTAPGDGWTPQDLAVLTIERGGDILWREGIHILTRMVYPLPGLPPLPMELNIPIIPPEYRVKVDWGTGVCGELLEMFLP